MVDVFLPVSPISSSLEGVSLGSESSSGSTELEGPQEVVSFLEVGSNAVDFVNKVLDGADIVLAKGLIDQGVGGKRNTLLVDLAVTSLENKFADGLAGRISESDVGLNSSEHVGGGFVDSNEDSVVELSESEESHDADDFGVELVNTADPHDKGQFRLGRDVDLTGKLGLNRQTITFLRASISARVAFW